MSAPPSRVLDRSASKRARSTDSSRSGASTPVPKAPKTEEGDQAPDNASVPAFLRQSATGTLPRPPCIGDSDLHDAQISLVGH